VGLRVGVQVAFVAGRAFPTQPLRGLIPTLLDPQAAEPLVEGTRLYEFRPSPSAPSVCDRPG
jgi:hypothetical protein